MSEEGDTPPIIILDNGSGYLKAGFSNSQLPEVCIPALIGRQMLRYGEEISLEEQEKANIEYKEIMIGDEVIPYRSLLELSHPVNEGRITNVDDLGKLWDYAINKKLGVDDPSDKKVIVTEAPMNPMENKIKICEVLFEQIGVDAINIEAQAKCSLFCEGIESGLVLDSGDGVTHCIPISNGVILQHNIERMDIAGRHITEFLIRLLQLKGYAFNSSADFEFVRELKERYCFISNDLEGDRELEKNTSYYNSYYLLPDETRLHISNEKFEAPEILFKPYLFGKEFDGIHEMMFKSINSCPLDIRPSLYRSIVLSGANTLFPGFASRIENEMKSLYKEEILKQDTEKKIKISINVIDSPRRRYSVFLGAGIIGNYYNRPESDDYWISRDEWLECEEGSEKTREKLLIEKCQSYFKEGSNYK